jgi:hypothetical protein
MKLSQPAPICHNSLQAPRLPPMTSSWPLLLQQVSAPSSTRAPCARSSRIPVLSEAHLLTKLGPHPTRIRITSLKIRIPLPLPSSSTFTQLDLSSTANHHHNWSLVLRQGLKVSGCFLIRRINWTIAPRNSSNFFRRALRKRAFVRPSPLTPCLPLRPIVSLSSDSFNSELTAKEDLIVVTHLRSRR